MGTVQRARVYADGSTEESKKSFREDLRSELERLENEYRQQVSEEKHIQNILTLSSRLSSGHKDILQKGCFRLGLAQKALNLYLKYLWCLGFIPEPPHCPFDSIVIAGLDRYYGQVNWTFITTPDEYRALIQAAKVTAKGMRLAEWELKWYNDFQSREV
jgi:hypothetical protein